MFGRVGLGVELAGWWASLGSDVRATNMMVVGTLRPVEPRLYVTGGVGFADAVLRDPASERLGRDRGVAFTLGASLELPPLGPISLMTNVDFLLQKLPVGGDFRTLNTFLLAGFGLAYRRAVGP